MTEGGGREEFIAIVGPTGAGKTALSLALGEMLDGEIISMDSRQVYRGMDIGTAKATLAERARIPHHGLDLIDPDQPHSAGQFARYARRRILDVRSRGRIPILVGGTGFFLRSLTHPLFEEPALDPVRRGRLQTFLEGKPSAELERWVAALDPARARLAAQGGPQRMVRTCMIALLTGYRLSDWHARGNEPSPLRGLVVVVGIPTDVLDRRIDERVSSMEREGLVEEVRALLDAGYRSTHPGMSGVGYREVADHVGGRATLEEALERTRLATRQYARRQRTWFRRQLPPGSIEVDGTRPIMELARGIAAEWERRGGLAGHRPDTRGGSGRRSGERALTG